MIAWMLSLPALAAPPSPSGVLDLVWARPFTLDAAETYTMRGDRPAFTGGVLVELRADPALLAPSQVGEPVLYAGDMPAFRFNWDYVGGCVVAFVPGEVDLGSVELYFGAPDLPERVTAASGAEQRANAQRRGVKPLPAGPALDAGGGPVPFHDLRDLEAAAMARVAACSTTPADHRRAGAQLPVR